MVQLVDLFRRHGYQEASLSQIAQLAGLDRASLNYHFPGGKAEMIKATIDYIDAWLDVEILQPLKSSNSPAQKLEQMCNQLEEFFDQGRRSDLWALMLLEQSRDDLFGSCIRQLLWRWVEAIASVLQEAGLKPRPAIKRAEAAVLQLQHSFILARALGSSTPFRRTIEALKKDWQKL